MAVWCFSSWICLISRSSIGNPNLGNSHWRTFWCGLRVPLSTLRRTSWVRWKRSYRGEILSWKDLSFWLATTLSSAISERSKSTRSLESLCITPLMCSRMVEFKRSSSTCFAFKIIQLLRLTVGDFRSLLSTATFEKKCRWSMEWAYRPLFRHSFTSMRTFSSVER